MKKILLKLIDVYKKYIYESQTDCESEAVWDMLKTHHLQNAYYDIINKEKMIDYDIFEKNYNYIIKRNKMYDDLAEDLHANFVDDNIKVIFLKGYALKKSIYKNNSTRYFNDIDILIHQNDIPKVEKILIEKNFRYGKYYGKELYLASRREIIAQRINTHELYNLTQKKSDIVCNVDINFKFSWVGVVQYEKMQEIPFEFLWENTISVDGKYILNNEIQFIHLCSHFYNEAVYFDFNYDKKIYKQIKDMKLFRIVDILMLINLNLDIEKIYCVCKKYNCVYKIEYILAIIINIFGEELIRAFGDFFIINKSYKFYFITKFNDKIYWGLSIYELLFDFDKKMNKYLEVTSGRVKSEK